MSYKTARARDLGGGVAVDAEAKGGGLFIAQGKRESPWRALQENLRQRRSPSQTLLGTKESDGAGPTHQRRRLGRVCVELGAVAAGRWDQVQESGRERWVGCGQNGPVD